MRETNTGGPHVISIAQRGAVAFVALVALGVWLGWQRSDASATPPAPSSAPATSSSDSAAQPAPSASAPPSTTVEVVFTTTPAVNATVTWGKQRLGQVTGRKPLVVVRPRDSGPLDVVVSAPGFLPVHTRAHTFADNKLLVKLTRPDQKSTLLGYRQPIDAGPSDAPDGGVPELISTDELPSASTPPAGLPPAVGP
jgi:hypothetical protein